MTGRIFLAFWLAVVIPLAIFAARLEETPSSCAPPDFPRLRC